MQPEMAQISKSSLEQVLFFLENVTCRLACCGYALRLPRSVGQE